MVGSRKLTRLLEHAQRDGAKVVLVGDDRQLAAIDAGGGFRALRLRLGASELTENRRQLHAWERDAIELVRQGLVDEAVAAYREHGRVVAADSKQQMTFALLSDWWAAYREAEQDPAQDVVLLAARRDEADRLNTACQHVLARNGRLGAERLGVEDQEVAVGDRVVCGRNALRQLGVANGTRGEVTALDPRARTLTLRLDASADREVTLPRWYLDGRRAGERNRRVDLAYATTGHRAQGLTRWRALVRLTGREDANWLTVQLSRARQETRLYATVGPEPQGPAELDLAEHDAPDVYVQFATSLARDGSQHLAIDTPSTPELRRLSTREVRAERDRLRGELGQAPRDRARELARATTHREQADQELAAARQQHPDRAAGMLRRRRGGPPAEQRGVLALAEQQADRAADRERQLRAHQQQRAGWLERNAHLGGAYRQVVRELGWRRRVAGLAAEQDRPAYVRDLLGAVPESTRGRRAWRQAAARIEEYRTNYRVQDPDRAFGPEPRQPTQQAAWRQARATVERVWHNQRTAERAHTAQDGRSERPTQVRSLPQPGGAGPERAAG
jgi:AAA domain